MLSYGIRPLPPSTYRARYAERCRASHTGDQEAADDIHAVVHSGYHPRRTDQDGQHQNGRSTYGHSMIIDPWGKILGELGGEGEGVLVADIDLAAVAEARGRVPALANARNFSLSVNPTGAD